VSDDEAARPRPTPGSSAERRDGPGDLADVRDEDLEPHAGLRYIARLFKVLALLLFLVMVGETVITLSQGTRVELVLLSATRLLVISALLWAGADLALMLIESNHDLRATRILVGRLNAKVQRMEDGGGPGTKSIEDP
jgi:hypothetical protein